MVSGMQIFLLYTKRVHITLPLPFSLPSHIPFPPPYATPEHWLWGRLTEWLPIILWLSNGTDHSPP